MIITQSPQETPDQAAKYAPALGGNAPHGDEPRLGGEAALAHLIAALHDRDARVRERAAVALAEIGGEKALDHLLHALHDEDSSVRAYTARALGHLHRDVPAAAIPHLHEALNDPSLIVREAAAEALGRIGNLDAILPLLAALRDQDQRVRERSAWALGQIAPLVPDGDLSQSISAALMLTLRRTAPMLIDRMSASITRALVGMGAAAIPVLIDTLQTANDIASEIAAEILGVLATRLLPTRPEVGGLHNAPEAERQIIVALSEAAASEDVFVSRAAIQAVGVAADHLSDESILSAVGALLAVFRSGMQAGEGVVVTMRPPILRRRSAGTLVPPDAGYLPPYIAMTLGALGAQTQKAAVLAIPILIEGLYTDDHELRGEGVRALGRIGARYPQEAASAVPALAARLHDGAARPFSRDATTGHHARAALRAIGTPDALQALGDGTE
jgi:HEAT repeat protein